MHRVSLTRTSQALTMGALALLVATIAAQLLVSSGTAPVLRTQVLGVQLEQPTPGARIVDLSSIEADELPTGPDLSVLAGLAITLPAPTTVAPSTVPATTVPATTAPATTVPSTIPSTTGPTTVPVTTTSSTIPTTTLPTRNDPTSLPKPDLTGIGTADTGERCDGEADEQLAASVLFAADELAGIDDARFGALVPFLFDCGDYVVTLVSRDLGHIEPVSSSTTADDERWLVEFFDANGVSLGATPPTADLPDEAIVGTTQHLVRVPEGTTQIRPVHVGHDPERPNAVVALGIVLSSPSMVNDCGLPTTFELAPGQGGSASVDCAEYAAVLVGDAAGTATVSVVDGVATVLQTARTVSAVVLVPVQK